MRTLDEIVNAVRSAEGEATDEELRYAVTAFDVLVSRLKVEENTTQLHEWFAAAETPLDEYLGSANRPDSPEAIAWYRAMRSAGVDSARNEPDLSGGPADTEETVVKLLDQTVFQGQPSSVVVACVDYDGLLKFGDRTTIRCTWASERWRGASWVAQVPASGYAPLSMLIRRGRENGNAAE